MRLLTGGLALGVLATSLAVISTPPAVAASTDFWTEPSYTSVFRDSLPSADSGRSIRLDTARNEFEAAQIVLRRNEAFRVDAVTPSALTGPSGSSIAASNVTFNFVDYQYLASNTYDSKSGKMDIWPGVRVGAGDYPDRLTNERSKAVAARSTQSIWVRAYVPATTAAGTYSGTVGVVTDKGTVDVPMSVQVRAVTLPESKDGAFTTALWQLFTGNISWDNDEGQIIENADYGYGIKLYSPEWWQLMENVARTFKDYRTNDLELPVIKLLADSGSLPNAQGGYDFDWTKFDQIVEFMTARGVVKRLEGFPEPAFSDQTTTGAIRDIEVIRNENGQPKQVWVDWNSAEGDRWHRHYLPALRDHLAEKGWTDIFWMHAGDEPQTYNVDDYLALARRMHQIWPEIRLGDAVDTTGVHQQIIDLNHQAVVQEFVYDAETDFYDGLVADGKEVWLYNSTAPRGNHLNRFIDQPQWYQRMTIWYAYGRNLQGYLHWAMNNWIYPVEEQDARGDGLIVRPDKERLSIEVTPRYESLRDGIEDYELLTLLGQRDPGLARGLAQSLVQRSDKFTPDIAYMQRIRTLALDAAAGQPITPDLARNAAATATSGNGALAVDGNPSTAWQAAPGSTIRVDLGRQVQLDAVRLHWTAAAGRDYRVQVSYDGVRWSDANVVSLGDGATDLVGLNSKARYLRVEVTAGSSPFALTDLEVAGFALAKQNVAGGRSYTATPAPNGQPDSGIESTDGVLADAHDDGRAWGYQAPVTSATVAIDLGSVRSVDSAKIHAYEEFRGYRPSSVKVATSVDGVTFTQRGVQFVPRGSSEVWYDLTFPPASARYVQVTFAKTYGGDASTMLIDEIEVYAAGSANLAANRPYAKTMPAATDSSYPDTSDKESTDGVSTTGFGVGYAYRLASAGARVTVDVTEESTDGTIAGGFGDGHGYGYHLTTAN